MKLLMGALILVCTPAFASTLVVNNNNANTSSPCNSAAYSTISAAVTAAAAGDTINVCPGVYTESVTINKKNIKLNGLTVNDSSLVELYPPSGGGALTTDVNPGGYYPNLSVILLVDSVSGVAISNISVNGAQESTQPCSTYGNAGIYFRNASGSVTNSAVANIGLNSDGSLSGCQEGHGILIDTGNAGIATVTVTGTSIHDFNKNGISANQSGVTLTATGNTITGGGPTTAIAQNGIEVIYGAKGTVNSNVISSVDYTPSSSSSTGILFYEAANSNTANSNWISETNGGVFFYQTNSNTANSNNISKSINYSAIGAQNSNSNTIEKNTLTNSGFAQDQAAIWICGSKNKVESNNIEDAMIGVQDDRTSSDGCSGATGNTITTNLYHDVGIDSETLTNASPHQLSVRSQPGSGISPHKGMPKP